MGRLILLMNVYLILIFSLWPNLESMTLKCLRVKCFSTVTCGVPKSLIPEQRPCHSLAAIVTMELKEKGRGIERDGASVEFISSIGQRDPLTQFYLRIYI